MNIIEIRQTAEELSQISKDVICEICGRTFKNSSAKRMHSVKTHFILKKLSDISLQSRSIKSQSFGETRFFCPNKGCNKFFKSRKLLIQHMKKTHDEKKFHCNMCGGKFGLERDLKYHSSKTCPVAKTLDILAPPSTSKNQKKLHKTQKVTKKLVDVAIQTENNNTNGNGKWVLIPVVFKPGATKKNVVIQTGEIPMTIPPAAEENPIQEPWTSSTIAQNSYPTNSFNQLNCQSQNYDIYPENNYQTPHNFGYIPPIHQPIQLQEQNSHISYEYNTPSCPNQVYIHQNWKHNETQTLPIYETDTSQQDYWPIEDSTTNAVATQTAQSSWSRSQDFGTQFSWDDFNATQPTGPIDQQYMVQGTQTMPIEEIDHIDWFSTNIPLVRETNEIGSMTETMYET